MEEKSVNIKSTQHQNDLASKDMLTKRLEMKCEELTSLNRELVECKLQRDRFKLMAEQMQERFLRFKRQINDTHDLEGYYNLEDHFKILDLLAETREQNKCLRLQVEMLRQKLGDTKEDVQVPSAYSNGIHRDSRDIQSALAIHQREEIIEQLEKLNVKCSQLQTDLQSVQDEKHELQTERDVFKCKAHRLNHELSKALNASKPVDLDALINENRYLQERLQQLLEEKELAKQAISKYKSMVDNKQMKGSIKLDVNTATATGTIMTNKQAELLHHDSCLQIQKSATAMSDLRYLCKTLTEALNDKTLALAHQKKANKILALRVCELDSEVQSPSAKLLEGYKSVDTECEQDFVKSMHVSGYSVEDIGECNTLTNNDGTKGSVSSLQGQVAQQLHSIQNSLPKNLGGLVQKAINNLRESNKVEI